MKTAKGIRKYIGLMFRTRKTEPLIFEFDKPVYIPIHSWFVFFPFLIEWYLEDGEPDKDDFRWDIGFLSLIKDDNNKKDFVNTISMLRKNTFNQTFESTLDTIEREYIRIEDIPSLEDIFGILNDRIKSSARLVIDIKLIIKYRPNAKFVTLLYHKGYLGLKFSEKMDNPDCYQLKHDSKNKKAINCMMMDKFSPIKYFEKDVQYDEDEKVIFVKADLNPNQEIKVFDISEY